MQSPQCAYRSCINNINNTPIDKKHPCPYCSLLSYCSIACRILDWDFNHKAACTQTQSQAPTATTSAISVQSTIDTSMNTSCLDTSTMGDRKKKTLQDYEIINQKDTLSSDLGKGSFGQVRLVRERANPENLYAMKMINKKQLKSYGGTDFLKREIKIQRKLDHPHIIKLHHYFEDKESVYLVLEYAEKGNLFSHLQKRRKFTEQEAFVYFFQTCVGIDYLHKKGIIHRDLKPENLLLDKQRNIKLCDFGYSVEDLGKRLTFCGTIDYMAPEVVGKNPHNYKVDIWSIGVLLYELLHGYPPFKGLTSHEKFKNILEHQLKCSGVSREAESLITMILKPNPNDRPEFDVIFSDPWIIKYGKELNLDIKSYIYKPSKKDKDLLPADIAKKEPLTVTIDKPITVQSEAIKSLDISPKAVYQAETKNTNAKSYNDLSPAGGASKNFSSFSQVKIPEKTETLAANPYTSSYATTTAVKDYSYQPHTGATSPQMPSSPYLAKAEGYSNFSALAHSASNIPSSPLHNKDGGLSPVNTTLGKPMILSQPATPKVGEVRTSELVREILKGDEERRRREKAIVDEILQKEASRSPVNKVDADKKGFTMTTDSSFKSIYDSLPSTYTPKDLSPTSIAKPYISEFSATAVTTLKDGDISPRLAKPVTHTPSSPIAEKKELYPPASPSNTKTSPVPGSYLVPSSTTLPDKYQLPSQPLPVSTVTAHADKAKEDERKKNPSPQPFLNTANKAQEIVDQIFAGFGKPSKSQSPTPAAADHQRFHTPQPVPRSFLIPEKKDSIKKKEIFEASNKEKTPSEKHQQVNTGATAVNTVLTSETRRNKFLDSSSAIAPLKEKTVSNPPVVNAVVDALKTNDVKIPAVTSTQVVKPNAPERAKSSNSMAYNDNQVSVKIENKTSQEVKKSAQAPREDPPVVKAPAEIAVNPFSKEFSEKKEVKEKSPSNAKPEPKSNEAPFKKQTQDFKVEKKVLNESVALENSMSFAQDNTLNDTFGEPGFKMKHTFGQEELLEIKNNMILSNTPSANSQPDHLNMSFGDNVLPAEIYQSHVSENLMQMALNQSAPKPKTAVPKEPEVIHKPASTKPVESQNSHASSSTSIASHKREQSPLPRDKPDSASPVKQKPTNKSVGSKSPLRAKDNDSGQQQPSSSKKAKKQTVKETEDNDQEKTFEESTFYDNEESLSYAENSVDQEQQSSKKKKGSKENQALEDQEGSMVRDSEDSMRKERSYMYNQSGKSLVRELFKSESKSVSKQQGKNMMVPNQAQEQPSNFQRADNRSRSQIESKMILMNGQNLSRKDFEVHRATLLNDYKARWNNICSKGRATTATSSQPETNPFGYSVNDDYDETHSYYGSKKATKTIGHKLQYSAKSKLETAEEDYYFEEYQPKQVQRKEKSRSPLNQRYQESAKSAQSTSHRGFVNPNNSGKKLQGMMDDFDEEETARVSRPSFRTIRENQRTPQKTNQQNGFLSNFPFFCGFFDRNGK